MPQALSAVWDMVLEGVEADLLNLHDKVAAERKIALRRESPFENISSPLSLFGRTEPGMSLRDEEACCLKRLCLPKGRRLPERQSPSRALFY